MKKILALILALVMVMALCACGSKEETTEAPAAEAPVAEAATAAEAPAAEAPAVEGAASGEMGGATGEMAQLDQSGEIADFTFGGVTGVLTYAETDNGDQETKGIMLTWQGVEYTGKIDKGVYTADNEADQALFEAYQEAYEANNTVGPASGEPSAEPAA